MYLIAGNQVVQSLDSVVHLPLAVEADGLHQCGPLLVFGLVLYAALHLLLRQAQLLWQLMQKAFLIKHSGAISQD